MTLKELLGFGTQNRSIWMIGPYAFAKRETRMSEESVTFAVMLSRLHRADHDPDGAERCVACNLCAVACPVAVFRCRKQRR